MSCEASAGVSFRPFEASSPRKVLDEPCVFATPGARAAAALYSLFATTVSLVSSVPPPPKDIELTFG